MTVPEHLHINGRTEDQSFTEDDHLYRGYTFEEYDFLEDLIKTETVKFPDFSCNWNRYSEPVDVRYRLNGRKTDGCYSFNVTTARYKKIATPVHDPIDHPEYPNYSHTEIRVCRETDPPNFVPPKNRKLKSKSKKLAYRENMVNNLSIEIKASQ